MNWSDVCYTFLKGHIYFPNFWFFLFWYKKSRSPNQKPVCKNSIWLWRYRAKSLGGADYPHFPYTNRILVTEFWKNSFHEILTFLIFSPKTGIFTKIVFFNIFVCIHTVLYRVFRLNTPFFDYWHEIRMKNLDAKVKNRV